MAALKKLKPSNKDYLTIKTKLIAELGYITDSTKPMVVDYLNTIYQQTTDTSIFQNEVMQALARHKTNKAIKLFKELVMQDPPAFEKDYDYTVLFGNLQDSLALAATLYPELLQLTTLQDYKEPVTSLLVKLVDSGFIKAGQYESFYNKIYFDAKIALKKQQGKDEKKMEADKKAEDNDDDNNTEIVRTYSNNYSGNNSNEDLDDYAVLLIPFYDSNANMPKFFDKLLRSKNEELCMNTAVLLLRNNKPVADSILNALAEKDRTRGILFTKLEKIKRLDKFPAKYNTQPDIARSYLVGDKNYAKIDSIVFIGKQLTTYEHKKGTVYFFKYRIKKDEVWKIGLSGLQPENAKKTSSSDKLSFMTDKKLRDDKPILEQFQEQLKKLLFSTHKSAKNFYEDDGGGYRFKKSGDYEE